jgi:hypothetical protein
MPNRTSENLLIMIKQWQQCKDMGQMKHLCRTVVGLDERVILKGF